MYAMILSAIALLIGIGRRIVRGSVEEEGLPETTPAPKEGEMEEVNIA